MKIRDFFCSVLLGAMCFGSLVGAGFASGKEIWFYFSRFSYLSIPFIIVASILLSFFIYKILVFGKNHSIHSIRKFYSILFPKCFVMGEIFFAISNLLLLSSMLAGADALFPPSYFRIYSLITVIFSILISWLRFTKITKINAVVVPCLLLIITVAFTLSLSYQNFHFDLIFNEKNLVTSSFCCILYVLFNIFLVSFILVKLGNIYPRQTFKLASFISCILLIISLLGINFSILFLPHSSTFDMPILAIINFVSPTLKPIAIFVIWIGIFTTAITSIFILSSYLNNYFHSFKLASISVGIIAMLLSGVGFSNIIAFCYPIIAVFGGIFILRLLKCCPKNNI